MIWVVLVALPVGVLVGMMGVGGLFLPAALGLATGDPQGAAGTSSLAFCFTGAVSLAVLLRRRRLDWSQAAPLGAAAAPGAVVGSLLAGRLPGTVLVLLLAGLCLLSGGQALLTGGRPGGGRTRLSPAAMAAVGALAGLGSALTGTGGPVLLVPLLLALGMSVVRTVALGLFVQVPVVACATATYAAQGLVDVHWGLVLGAVAGAGTLVGLAIAGRVHPDVLRRAVAWTLAVTGLLLAARVLW